MMINLFMYNLKIGELRPVFGIHPRPVCNELYGQYLRGIFNHETKIHKYHNK